MLTYNKTLNTDSVPAASAFEVTVIGSQRRLALDNPVAIRGSTVTLTLASHVTYRQGVTMSYTAPAANPILDEEGNAAEAFTGREVDNTTPPPGITVTAPSSPVPEGGSATYTVKLDTQPSGQVLLDVSSDNADVTVRSTLVFGDSSSFDYRKPMRVTIHAAHDADTADETATITHRSSSSTPPRTSTRRWPT